MLLTEDIAKTNLKLNMFYLMEKFEISTKKEMAKKLDVSLPTLSNVLKDGQIPNIFPFFVNARNAFGYTIDELLYQDIQSVEAKIYTSTDGLTEKKIHNSLGLFMVYHFKTTAFKGRERCTDAEALRAGVLFVTRNPENPLEPKVSGTFGLKRDRAYALYADLMKIADSDGMDEAVNYFENIQKDYHVYKGGSRIMAGHIHHALNYNDRDMVTMIFHQPNGQDKYLGGLGAMLSLGKGRYPEPCMQNIGLVRGALPCANELIAQNILTHYPILKAYDQIDDLCSMLAALYSKKDPQEDLGLSEEDKKVMALHHVDKVINEVVEKNLFRLFTITAQDDDEFYHFIKKVFKISKGC